jgi:hypothetical protein
LAAGVRNPRPSWFAHHSHSAISSPSVFARPRTAVLTIPDVLSGPLPVSLAESERPAVFAEPDRAASWYPCGEGRLAVGGVRVRDAGLELELAIAQNRCLTRSLQAKPDGAIIGRGQLRHGAGTGAGRCRHHPLLRAARHLRQRADGRDRRRDQVNPVRSGNGGLGWTPAFHRAPGAMWIPRKSPFIDTRATRRWEARGFPPGFGPAVG